MRNFFQVAMAVTMGLSISGCGGLVNSVLDKNKDPDINEQTDPIDHCLEMLYRRKQHASLIILPIKKSPEKTDFGRQYIDQEYVEFDSDMPYTLRSALKEVCSVLGGEVRADGWCAQKQSLLPLFFYKIKIIHWNPSELAKKFHGYRDGSDIEIYAPSTMSEYQDPNWLRFAYSKGFIDPSTWRRQEQLREEQRQAEERQKLQEEKRRQAEMVAMEKRRIEEARAKYQADLHAEQARIARENPVLLSKIGITVCKKIGGWNGPEFPRYRGYVEGHSENRIKIRVNERQTSYGWKDGNFQPQIMWDQASNWFLCQ